MLHKPQGIALQLAVLRRLAGIHQSRQQAARIQGRLAGYPGINSVARYSGKQSLPSHCPPLEASHMAAASQGAPTWQGLGSVTRRQAFEDVTQCQFLSGQPAHTDANLYTSSWEMLGLRRTAKALPSSPRCRRYSSKVSLSCAAQRAGVIPSAADKAHK